MLVANDPVAKYILKFIKKNFNGQKLLITIDGKSGTGKTSICKRVKQLSKQRITIVHADIFARSYKNISRSIKPNIDLEKFYTKIWFDVFNLRKFLKEFSQNDQTKTYFEYWPERQLPGKKVKKSKINIKNKILILEGCFSSHSKILGNISSKKIFLTIDRKNLNKRVNKRREVKKLKNDKTIVSGLFHKGYEDYLKKYKANSKSDLIIKMRVKN